MSSYSPPRGRGSANAASPSDVPTSSGSKRKRNGENKFYAVRAGHKTGVFLTWADCYEQIKGFKGAIYKSFPSLADAETFVAGQDPTQDPNSASFQNRKFYAVRSGHVPGIYHDWPSASKQITGWSKPKHRCFSSRAEAEAFMREGEAAAAEQPSSLSSAYTAAAAADKKQKISPDSFAAMPGLTDPSRAEYGSVESSRAPSPLATTLDTPYDCMYPLGQESAAGEENLLPSFASGMTSKPHKQPGTLEIYTDGSSLGNGTANSVAGVGVYFGENDERNLSEGLSGPRQTNQRAELTAILRALEIAPQHRPVVIHTDSTYAIKCCTEWAPTWIRNGWRTARGQPVENRDLVQLIVNKMDARQSLDVRTQFSWVKGHAGNPGNVAADYLANGGAQQAWAK